MSRRGDADPLLLQSVSERLARLLAETPPRQPEAEAGTAAAVPPATEHGSTGVDLLDVDEVPPPRRFTRLHLGVVAVLLLAGLLGAGWSTWRARPVAIAAPVTVSNGPAATTAPAGPTSAPSASPSPSSDASASPGGTVVVHVLGAVRRPGLVTLDAHARVQDAVDAAGGFTRHADAGELNLAQVLTDGQQVVIGTDERPEGEVRGSGGGAGSGAGDGGADPGAASGPLDLNASTQAQLEELPGVGPVTAQKILTWRQQHGRFSKVQELQEVDGIGPKTYAEIAPHVRV